MQENQQLIRKTAMGIAVLPNHHQVKIIEILFDHIDDIQKERIFKTVGRLIYPSSRWLAIESWMEKRFISDMSRTPRQVASMGMYYMKINRRMTPLMIKLAQKVKNRLSKRIKKQEQ